MGEAPTNTKTWVLLVTLLGLGAVMAYLFMPAGEATWGEPTDPSHDAPDAPDEGSMAEPSIGPPPDEVEATPTDREAARGQAASNRPRFVVVGDGGTLGLEGLTNSPVGAPEEPASEPEAERVTRLPVQIEERTPEREHARAVFLLGVLAQRLADTRAAAAAARAEGNVNRAARLERQAERMARELPNAEAVEHERAEILDAAEMEAAALEAEQAEGEALEPAIEEDESVR